MKDELEPQLPWSSSVYTPQVYANPATGAGRTVYKYTSITNPAKLDQPFAKNAELLNFIRQFLKQPSNLRYIRYAQVMYDTMVRHNYTYNEQIVSHFPIYALSFDIDITDKAFIARYFSRDDPEADLLLHQQQQQVTTTTTSSSSSALCRQNCVDQQIKNKLKTREELIKVMLKTFQIMDIHDITEDNTEFTLYESLNDCNELQRTSSVAKLGFRFIVRSQLYVVAHAGVMVNIIRIANFVLNFLNDYLPGPCIDEAPYLQQGHYMRLPMNCKRSSTGNMIRPLIPIVTSKKLSFVPSAGLIHHRHTSLQLNNFKVITNTPNIHDCPITRSVLPSDVTLRMLKNKLGIKQGVGGGEGGCDDAAGAEDWCSRDFTYEIDTIACPIIYQTLMDKLQERGGHGGGGGGLYPTDLKAERVLLSNRYSLATHVPGTACVKKIHLVPETNPLSIYCFIKKIDQEQFVCNAYQRCWGSDCQNTFLCCVPLVVMLPPVVP